MGGNFMKNVKFFLGLDEEDEEIMEEPVEIENEEVKTINNPKKVLNIHTNSQIKVVVCEPIEFEECPKIVDNLKNRKPVIINLEKLENDLAKKIFDFLNGAVYALDGNIQKISKGIFILAPNNVDIGGNISEEFKSKGIFPWQK